MKPPLTAELCFFDILLDAQANAEKTADVIAPMELPPVSVPAPDKFTYRLYGLDFRTSERIPHLRLSEEPAKEPITVEFGPAPKRLEQVTSEDEYFQANDDEYLVHYPNYCRAHVLGGRSIRFESLAELSSVQRWYTTLSLGASVAGLQRDLYPLHASVVRIAGGAAAFCAPSGSGKSTLVAALVNRGFELLGDDLCLISRGDGQVSIAPGPPEIRLLSDALPLVGLTGAPTLDSDHVKSVISANGIAGRNQAEAIPLKHIYELAFCGREEWGGLFRLEGLEAMKPLIDNVRLRMRVHLLPHRLRCSTFETLTRLPQQTAVYRFVRPRDRGLFDRHLNLLAEHLSAQ